MSVNQTVSYIPKCPPITFEVPEGWELAEPEPREPKAGECFMFYRHSAGEWAGDTNGNYCPGASGSPGWVHCDGKPHYALGHKTFIICKKFTPKIGDIVEVKCGNRWYKRIFLKDVNGKIYTFTNVESLEDFNNCWDVTVSSQWEAIRPVQN